MNRRKSVIGIAVLFALALSAFTASSASAGATLFTCVKGGTQFAGAHCLTGPGEYKHVAWSGITTGIATNKNTASGTTAAQSGILKSTLAGVNTEVTCKNTEGTGEISNKEEGGAMLGHATGKLTFTECVVKAPAEKGCKVKGGTIVSEEITGKTLGGGAEVEIKPTNAENKFTTITIEGCSIAALNNPFPVTGSLKAKTSGATLFSTHAEVTTQNTLKFGGQKAGLDGALTIEAHSFAGEETHPITVTETTP